MSLCAGALPRTAAGKKLKPSWKMEVTCGMGAPREAPTIPGMGEDPVAVRAWEGPHRHWGRCRAV